MRIDPTRHLVELKPSELNPFIEKLRHHPQYAPQPKSLFDRLQGKKVIVDLGCGNGHFLESALRQNPELVGIGVDRRFKRLFKTAEKIKAYGGFVTFWDVPDFCEQAPAEFFSMVSMQFPDPWPKSKHAKHRMLKADFFKNVYRILRPGGSFIFISDCQEYFEFLVEENSKTKTFPIMIAQKADLFKDHSASLFKLKMLSRNIPIFSLHFRKIP